jgi:hypothetical protein
MEKTQTILINGKSVKCRALKETDKFKRGDVWCTGAIVPDHWIGIKTSSYAYYPHSKFYVMRPISKPLKPRREKGRGEKITKKTLRNWHFRDWPDPGVISPEKWNHSSQVQRDLWTRHGFNSATIVVEIRLAHKRRGKK